MAKTSFAKPLPFRRISSSSSSRRMCEMERGGVRGPGTGGEEDQALLYMCVGSQGSGGCWLLAPSPVPPAARQHPTLCHAGCLFSIRAAQPLMSFTGGRHGGAKTQ
jgi:hypothetical protein